MIERLASLKVNMKSSFEVNQSDIKLTKRIRRKSRNIKRRSADTLALAHDESGKPRNWEKPKPGFHNLSFNLKFNLYNEG